MQIYGPYRRPPVEKETITAESITETVGYVPPDVQITQMLNAGITLQASRQGIYDTDIDPAFDDDGPLDRLDYRDADMVDVHESVVEAKLRSKSSEEASEGDSDEPKKKTRKKKSDPQPEESDPQPEESDPQSEETEQLGYSPGYYMT